MRRLDQSLCLESPDPPERCGALHAQMGRQLEPRKLAVFFEEARDLAPTIRSSRKAIRSAAAFAELIDQSGRNELFQRASRLSAVEIDRSTERSVGNCVSMPEHGQRDPLRFAQRLMSLEFAQPFDRARIQQRLRRKGHCEASNPIRKARRAQSRLP